MGAGDTFRNALLGALVAVVLSALPFSPLLGGLLAGYLEGGDRRDGVRVGAIAGVIALVPLAGVLVILVGFVGLFFLGGLPVRAGAVGAILLLVFGLLVALYTVGVSALGGWLGNYVRYDTDLIE